MMHVSESSFISRILVLPCLTVFCAVGNGARIGPALKVKHQVGSGQPKRSICRGTWVILCYEWFAEIKSLFLSPQTFIKSLLHPSDWVDSTWEKNCRWGEQSMAAGGEMRTRVESSVGN